MSDGEKKEPEKTTTNVRGDVVDPGEHKCCVCKQTIPAVWMWSTDPKAKCCLACYYDL